MNRVLGVLALAVLATAGCRAYGPGYGDPYGASSCCGCGDACSCGDDCQCGPAGDCGCGCETYGDCGCGDGCGCEPCGDGRCGECQGGCCGTCDGGVCDHVATDCPLCQCSNCGMFQRNCGCGCDDGCGPYGGGPYDYSACQACNHCGGCGCGLCGGTGCLCGPTPCGANCPRPACDSGDHVYNFAPGPPVGQTAYPYYTTRGPRDFLLNNPPSIGPY